MMIIAAIARSAFEPSFRAEHGLPRLMRRVSVGQRLQHVASHTHYRIEELYRVGKPSPHTPRPLRDAQLVV